MWTKKYLSKDELAGFEKYKVGVVVNLADGASI